MLAAFTEANEMTGADPDIRFTTTPENVMRYAEFMHEIGSIDNLPQSWRDLFFPEIHDVPGG